MMAGGRHAASNPYLEPMRQSGVAPADRIWVATGLLMIWDAVSVLMTGCLGAVLYHTIFISPEIPLESANDLLATAIRTSLVGGLLAPLVIGRMPVHLSELGQATVLQQAAMRIIILFGVILTIGFLSRTLIYLPRLWMLAWATSTFVFVLSGRLFLHLAVAGKAVQGILQERIAVVGESGSVAKISARLRRSQGDRVEVICCETGDGNSGQQAGQSVATLVEHAKQYPLDRVLIAVPPGSFGQQSEIVNQLKALDVDIILCPDLFGDDRYVMHLVQLAGMPMSVIARRPIRQWGWVLKLLEDKVLATFLVIWLLPLIGAISISIRLDSPGPVFFRQRRHGINNTEFDIIKFRTMTWRVQPDGVMQQTLPNDRRVTRVGRFLRRSSLDELPQLFNVLRGEMSLVGPRPHPIVMRTENLLGAEIMDDYSHRHRVKPGMTGWAQVNGYRGATNTTDEVRQRVAHDNWYIDNWSVLFDLKILALTPLRLVFDRKRAY